MVRVVELLCLSGSVVCFCHTQYSCRQVSEYRADKIEMIFIVRTVNNYCCIHGKSMAEWERVQALLHAI